MFIVRIRADKGMRFVCLLLLFPTSDILLLLTSPYSCHSLTPVILLLLSSRA